MNFLHVASGSQDTAPPQPQIFSALLPKNSAFNKDRLLWELCFLLNFVVTRLHHISDGTGSSLVFGSIYLCLLTDQGPQFIEVDS